jgi:hypothetical protein
MLVQILSLPTCVRCDGTLASLKHFTGDFPGMRVERLNVADRPELLEQYGLLTFEYAELATHAVVINGTLAGLEHPSEDTLRRWLDQTLARECVGRIFGSSRRLTGMRLFNGQRPSGRSLDFRRIALYVCGITSYVAARIGHAMVLLTYDRLVQ